jgi:lysophospholipid acyltransferase (LPLAT)-like uncharacterized protein
MGPRLRLLGLRLTATSTSRPAALWKTKRLMKLRNPRLIRLASWLTAAVLRPWVATLRGQVEHGPAGPHPADPARQRFVYVLWHEALLAAFLFRRYPGHVLISQHADGELIAQACERLGVAVIRGSSRKGGARALLQMCRLSEQSHIVITPDGPRGPRRRMPEGVIQLAGLVGLPILPVGVGFQSAWRANSWDRFAVPRPFSTIHFHAGAAIHVPAQLDDNLIETYRQETEAALLAATDRAERVAAGERPVATPNKPSEGHTEGHTEESGDSAAAPPPPHSQRRPAASTSSLTAT